jgi:hypothetical protein
MKNKDMNSQEEKQSEQERLAAQYLEATKTYPEGHPQRKKIMQDRDAGDIMTEISISLADCETVKRQAESLLRYVRSQNTQEKTAVICGISTYEVGDICGTSKHPDRKRYLYSVEMALKIIKKYEENYGKKIIIKKNPDTARRISDKEIVQK